MIAVPIPVPSSIIGSAICGKYWVDGPSWLSQVMPAKASPTPPAMSWAPLKRRPSFGTTCTIVNISSVIGRNARPADKGE